MNRRIVLDDSNARAIDIKNYIAYNKKFLNIDVDIASKKTKKEVNLDFYKDYREVDFNDYDEVTIFNFNLNFFGGYIDDETISNMKKLAAYKGKITYLLTDPKLYLPFAWSSKICERLEKKGRQVGEETHPTVQDFYELAAKQITCVYCGRNYELFIKKLFSDSNTIFSPMKLEREIQLFEHVAMNSVPKMDASPINFEDKIYDICYYGNNRGGYRNKRLKHFIKDARISKNIIGFEIAMENAHFNPIMKYYEFGAQVKKSFSSLIIGDEEHNDCFTTYRFFEIFHLGIVGFIDEEFDSKKTLIENPKLKEFLYVQNSNDIIKKVKQLRSDEAFYNEIIQLQRNELGKFRI